MSIDEQTREEEEENLGYDIYFVLFGCFVRQKQNKTNKVMKMIDLCTENQKTKAI